jgi:molybdopterin-containing oxidoreductase family iron-sulfur binding subunit
LRNSYGNPNSKHIVYDAVSSSETLDALAVYGERALVDYDFQKLHLLFLVGADILGDWQGGGDSIYSRKNPKNGKMSRHSIRGEYDAVCGC